MAQTLLVNPSEALTLLRSLERRAVRAIETETWKLTAARLRHLEQFGLAPTVPATGGRGVASARLYNVEDVALLRLWLRLSAEVGPSLARFALAYLGDALRAALEARRPVVLVVRGKRAGLMSAREAAAVKDAAVSIPLMDLLVGVGDAMTAVREDKPELWAGLGWFTPAEALEELVPA